MLTALCDHSPQRVVQLVNRSSAKSNNQDIFLSPFLLPPPLLCLLVWEVLPYFFLLFFSFLLELACWGGTVTFFSIIIIIILVGIYSFFILLDNELHMQH
ncbi:hypothetical protein HAX54_019077 [Datura stramonium]|uniref:Uncharacterized protein n=1 Tax=Datura stramonium TaxID=4076 RepID=A0ABS8UQF4_DATST|nr:hypothetical protein [Datura stramonium]